MENRLQNWKIGKKFNRNESGKIRKLKYMKKINHKTIIKIVVLKKWLFFVEKLLFDIEK